MGWICGLSMFSGSAPNHHDYALNPTYPSSLLLVQIFNFVYSLPQLFKIVPCPRHRLPVFDPKVRRSVVVCS